MLFRSKAGLLKLTGEYVTAVRAKKTVGPKAWAKRAALGRALETIASTMDPAFPAIGDADAVMFVVDATVGATDTDEAVVEVLRQRGWRAMLAGTRDALRMIEQGSGVEAVDGLINRNLLFSYFYSVGRALDDAHYYIVRSRAPWSPRGLTVRDWEALMWTVPAVQLADEIGRAHV